MSEPYLTPPSFIESNLFVICGSMPTIRKFFKHFAPRLMGASSSDKSYANRYGPSGYAGGGFDSKNVTIGGVATGPRSRKLRSQYENFDDDNEMEIFESASKDSDNGKNQSSTVTVDGSGAAQPDNGSEKAILQTTTFTVQYDRE